MTAKEYLSQAYMIDQRINAKLEQVMSLRNTASRATSLVSDMPRSSTPNVCRMEDIILKFIDSENEINAEIDQLVDLKREVRSVISQINHREYQTLLELRYQTFSASTPRPCFQTATSSPLTSTLWASRPAFASSSRAAAGM